jgi:DNA mismatch repair protein MutL
LFIEIPEGLLVIDQHALHERVLYDKLLQEIKSNQIIKQPLLFPEEIDLNPLETTNFQQWQQEFGKIGFETEKTTNGFSITTIPQIFVGISSRQLMSDMLNDLCLPPSEYKSSQSVLEKLASTSCRAAIKAGDVLTKEEIIGLLKYAKDTKNPYHCPHGRPTFFIWSITDIEKAFQRR